MNRSEFTARSSKMLEKVERTLGALEHESLDVQLSGDVLTLAFDDGQRYIVNAHSAAGQIWLAAERSAWHFDYVEDRDAWVASKTGDELLATLGDLIERRLAVRVVW
jgi:CyaY protein